MTESNCPICGAAIPASAPGGHCPNCFPQETPPAGQKPSSARNIDLGKYIPVPSVIQDSPPPPSERVIHVPTPDPSITPPATSGSSHDALTEVYDGGPGDTNKFDPIAQVQIPGYEVLEEIGAGGMGQVFKARHKHLDRLVAVKLLQTDKLEQSGFSERFLREAKTMAKLDHRHIVNVHDFGEVDGKYYFIMEYVHGTNLATMIRNGDLTPGQSYALVGQVCEALDYAHSKGVVHRDIKPANILVDLKGNIKVADFGLVKMLDEDGRMDHQLTMTHQVMGTPTYMAPEQRKGANLVDHRADIYSVGVMLYEMLTGEVPVGHFAPPSKKADVSPRVDEIVLRAMSSEPSERFQKISEIMTAIDTVYESPEEPATPGAPDASDQVAKARGQLIAIIVFLLVLVGGGVGGYLLLTQQGLLEGAPDLEEVVSLKSNVEYEYNQIMTNPWTSRYPDLVKQIDKDILAAGTFMDQKAFSQAIENYNTAYKNLQILYENHRKHTSLAEGLESLAVNRTKWAGVAALLPEKWAAADMAEKEARAHYEAGRTAEAKAAIARANEAFGKVETEGSVALKAQKAQKQWAEKLKAVDQALLTTHGQAAWASLQAKVAEAAKASDKPVQQAALYQDAVSDLENLVVQVEQRQMAALRKPLEDQLEKAKKDFEAFHAAVDRFIIKSHFGASLDSVDALVKEAFGQEAKDLKKAAELYTIANVRLRELNKQAMELHAKTMYENHLRKAKAFEETGRLPEAMDEAKAAVAQKVPDTSEAEGILRRVQWRFKPKETDAQKMEVTNLELQQTFNALLHSNDLDALKRIDHQKMENILASVQQARSGGPRSISWEPIYSKAYQDLQKIVARAKNNPSGERVKLTVQAGFTDSISKLVRAEIKVDGKSMGKRLLPYDIMVQKLGPTEIELIPESPNAWTFERTKTVNIRNDSENRVVFSLSRANAVFIFNITPPDAQVFSVGDGLLSGKTPISGGRYEAKPGEKVKFSIRRKGYRTETRDFLAQQGKVTDVSITLRK